MRSVRVTVRVTVEVRVSGGEVMLHRAHYWDSVSQTPLIVVIQNKPVRG